KIRAKLALNPHLRSIPLVSQVLEGLKRSVQSSPEGPQKFATILADMTRQLAAMDRYERRGLSRRKFAIRALGAARRQTARRGRVAGALAMSAPIYRSQK